jgi:hypothetical protein
VDLSMGIQDCPVDRGALSRVFPTRSHSCAYENARKRSEIYTRTHTHAHALPSLSHHVLAHVLYCRRLRVVCLGCASRRRGLHTHEHVSEGVSERARARARVCVCVCVWVCGCVCVCVCVCVAAGESRRAGMKQRTDPPSGRPSRDRRPAVVSLLIRVCVYLCACVHVCMCAYIYIYIYIYICVCVCVCARAPLAGVTRPDACMRLP